MSYKILLRNQKKKKKNLKVYVFMISSSASRGVGYEVPHLKQYIQREEQTRAT